MLNFILQALFQSAQHLYEKREGSGSGPVPLTNGSGSGFGRLKNVPESPTLLKRPGSPFKNSFSIKSRIQNTGKA